jgi:hypothetical protein
VVALNRRQDRRDKARLALPDYSESVVQGFFKRITQLARKEPDGIPELVLGAAPRSPWDPGQLLL